MSKCFKGKITVLSTIIEKELRNVISIPSLGRDDPEVGRKPRKLWLDLKSDANVRRERRLEGVDNYIYMCLDRILVAD